MAALIPTEAFAFRFFFICGRTFFFLWIAGLLSLDISAQQHKTDSLLALLQRPQADTARLEILKEITYQYSLSDPKKAIYYAQKACQIAQKSTLATLIAQTQINLGNTYALTSEYSNALTCFEKARQAAVSVDNPELLRSAYASLAWVYQEQGQTMKALQFQQKAVHISESLPERHTFCRLLLNIAATYQMLDRSEESFRYITKAMHLADSLQDSELLMYAYNAMGGFYEGQNQLSKAKQYYLRALEWSKKNGSTSIEAEVLNSLGMIASENTRYQEALAYYQHSLTLSEQLDDKTSQVNTLQDLAYVHFKQNSFKPHSMQKAMQKAEHYFETSLSVARLIDYLPGVASGLLGLGHVYEQTHRLPMAEKSTQQAIVLFKRMNLSQQLIEGYQLLTQIYRQQGKLTQALESYQQHVSWKDSVYNQEKSRQLQKLTVQYETAQKEQQIRLLSQKDRIHQLEINQQRLYLIGLLIVALLLIGLVTLLFRQRNLKIAQGKMETEQKLLRSQMNPHFIFNALGSIQNYILTHNPIQASSYLSHFAKLMRLTLENSREEFIPLEREIATLTHYLELQSLRFKDKFTYQVELDPRLDRLTTLVPPMFAQPLIENALEHGLSPKIEAGLIQVRFLLEGRMIRLEVEDNGMGYKRGDQNLKEVNNSIDNPYTGETIAALPESLSLKDQVASAKDKAAPVETEHRSLATQIIRERLVLLNRKTKASTSLEITHLTDRNNQNAGTLTSFLIPYQLT